MGGITGYIPNDSSLCLDDSAVVQERQAFNWFITITGVNIEDTMITTERRTAAADLHGTLAGEAGRGGGADPGAAPDTGKMREDGGMKLEQYSLSGGLTAEQIGLMKRKAIELVEQVGLHVPHDGILGLLRQHDGVKVEGQTVKFRPELVEKALREARYPLPEYYGKEWVISAGAHQPKMHDLDTGALRDTTLKDLKDLIKIGDALDTVGSAPCVPLDVPIHLQEIQMHKVAWENSRRRANDMFEHDPKPNVRDRRVRLRDVPGRRALVLPGAVHGQPPLLRPAGAGDHLPLPGLGRAHVGRHHAHHRGQRPDPRKGRDPAGHVRDPGLPDHAQPGQHARATTTSRSSTASSCTPST